MKSLRALALKYPECEEGIACKGTAIECSTFKVGGKAFLFLGTKDVRLKLADSLAEAKKLAAKEPHRYSVGAKGWIKVTFSEDYPLDIDVMKPWVGESYQLMAPKNATASKKKVAKKAPRKKKATR